MNTNHMSDQAITQVRVRPFDVRYSEDVCYVGQLSAEALYFETALDHYYEGMNVAVTHNSQREEIAKIVSTSRLSDGRWGVGIRIL